MKKSILGAALLVTLATSAQHDSIKTVKQGETKNPFTISGYAEAYYSYDFDKPSGHSRPGFFYNYNRHHEVNVNLAFIKGNYSTERVRANVAFAVGSYMNANYAAEPGTLKNIFEANAGYKLSAKKNLWFDIGIMPSHIGFESAIGKDNWTLTRSLVAENSPYFESGAKLTYGTDNGKLTLSAVALNGWQRITRVERNSLVSLGTQVYYQPTDKVILNYSTFFGTDKPDTARLYRTYHNFYGIFEISPNLGFTAGIDIGTEKLSPNGKGVNTWYTPVCIIRFTPISKWTVALRGEYFNDEQGVIIATQTPNGFRTVGASLNLDYLPLKNVALRFEGRYLDSKDAIFSRDGAAKDNATALTFATAISF